MLRCVGEALARGEQRVAKNPRDGQAYFAMALARTAMFRWALRRKQTVTAAQEAYGLWSCLERAQQEDPENSDSYLLTGLIRYHIDHLPDLSRFLSSLLITQGDRRRGLQDLKRAAMRGDLLKELARSELISVYLNFEKQPARALPFARDCRGSIPGITIFPLPWPTSIRRCGGSGRPWPSPGISRRASPRANRPSRLSSSPATTS